METDGNLIDATVALLRSRNFCPDTLQRLKQIVIQRKVRRLLIALLDAADQHQQTPEDDVYQAMETAQSLFAHDSLTACLLMSQLYGFASDLYMHDVCNFDRHLDL